MPLDPLTWVDGQQARPVRRSGDRVFWGIRDHLVTKCGYDGGETLAGRIRSAAAHHPRAMPVMVSARDGAASA